MKLRNDITVLALRTTVRLAWAMHAFARTVEDAGERLEAAIDRRAAKHGIDAADVLEPFLDPPCADAA
jgi:hypothetical protein